MATKKSTDEDGFQLVKKRRKRVPPQRTLPQSPLLSQDQTYDGPSPEEIVQKIIACRESLKETTFFSELLDMLRTANVPPYTEVVCYGIGHIGTSHIAQLQFALLLEMVTNNSSDLNPVIWVFDPVLHKQELTAIEDCGCQLLPQNEVCKRTINHPTLFYMPHCGRAMYNNVLWANWSAHKLTQVALIGNTLGSYQERYMDSYTTIASGITIHLQSILVNSKGEMKTQIYDMCLEYPLPTSYPDSTVFNDLSLHLFPREKLQHLSDREWTECPEPQIDVTDPEIIS